jgi:PqqD family protein of HPr-rel-A system
VNLSLRKGRPARRSDVWLRQSGGENAVYNPETGSVYLLNATAQAIWDLCDGDTRPEEMTAAIVEVTGLHPDVVSEDVERILLEFEAAGLVEWVS